jgi:hypothetical protein
MTDLDQTFRPDLAGTGDDAASGATGPRWPVPSRVPPAAVPPHTRRRPADGRPNVQISLRLPASWVGQLRERAIAAARREDCMITPQEIMRRIIADALRQPL